MLFHARIVGTATVSTVARDAQAVASLLTDADQCGDPPSQVTLLTDERATRDRVLAALDALAQVGSDSTALLCDGGHGDYATDGSSCLTMADTRCGFAGRGVRNAPRRPRCGAGRPRPCGAARAAGGSDGRCGSVAAAVRGVAGSGRQCV